MFYLQFSLRNEMVFIPRDMGLLATYLVLKNAKGKMKNLIATLKQSGVTNKDLEVALRALHPIVIQNSVIDYQYPSDVDMGNTPFKCLPPNDIDSMSKIESDIDNWINGVYPQIFLAVGINSLPELSSSEKKKLIEEFIKLANKLGVKYGTEPRIICRVDHQKQVGYFIVQVERKNPTHVLSDSIVRMVEDKFVLTERLIQYISDLNS